MVKQVVSNPLEPTVDDVEVEFKAVLRAQHVAPAAGLLRVELAHALNKMTEVERAAETVGTPAAKDGGASEGEGKISLPSVLGALGQKVEEMAVMIESVFPDPAAGALHLRNMLEEFQGISQSLEHICQSIDFHHREIARLLALVGQVANQLEAAQRSLESIREGNPELHPKRYPQGKLRAARNAYANKEKKGIEAVQDAEKKRRRTQGNLNTRRKMSLLELPLVAKSGTEAVANETICTLVKDLHDRLMTLHPQEVDADGAEEQFTAVYKAAAGTVLDRKEAALVEQGQKLVSILGQLRERANGLLEDAGEKVGVKPPDGDDELLAYAAYFSVPLGRRMRALRHCFRELCRETGFPDPAITKQLNDLYYGIFGYAMPRLSQAHDSFENQIVANRDALAGDLDDLEKDRVWLKGLVEKGMQEGGVLHLGLAQQIDDYSQKQLAFLVRWAEQETNRSLLPVLKQKMIRLGLKHPWQCLKRWMKSVTNWIKEHLPS